MNKPSAQRFNLSVINSSSLVSIFLYSCFKKSCPNIEYQQQMYCQTNAGPLLTWTLSRSVFTWPFCFCKIRKSKIFKSRLPNKTVVFLLSDFLTFYHIFSPVGWITVAWGIWAIWEKRFEFSGIYLFDSHQFQVELNYC